MMLSFFLVYFTACMVTLRVEKICQHRVQNRTSLCTVEDKHLLAFLNLEQALEEKVNIHIISGFLTSKVPKKQSLLIRLA
jgi:hypothetical protein